MTRNAPPWNSCREECCALSYEQLRDRAEWSTEVGDTLASARIYCSARQFIGPRQVRCEGIVRYEVAVKRGDCVDAADIESENPPGLQGTLIQASCSRRPQKPKLYSRSATHKGSNGLLKDNATAKIAQSYYPAKDNAGDPTEGA